MRNNVMMQTPMGGRPKASKPVSLARAHELLAHKDELHSFTRVFGWMGGRVARGEVLTAIQAHGAELSADVAHFDHMLAVTLRGKRTYIETDPLHTPALLTELRAQERVHAHPIPGCLVPA